LRKNFESQTPKYCKLRSERPKIKLIRSREIVSQKCSSKQAVFIGV